MAGMCNMWLFVTLCCLIAHASPVAVLPEQRCPGTSNGLSFAASTPLKQRHASLKGRLANCDVIVGNLELVNFGDSKNETFDWTFLKRIREVTGYVAVYKATLDYLPLDGLRLIRGRQLLSGSSLLIRNSEFKQLGLGQLSEISQGNVKMYDVPHLCFVQTINWQDIFNTNSQTTDIVHSTGNTCENSTCHSACQRSGSGCWGGNSSDCQSFTRLNCSQECSHRCQGKTALLSDCCHDECAAGCTGPTNTHCLGCRHLEDSGTCVSSCQPLQVYDPSAFQFVINPARMYENDLICVKACPSDRFTEGDKCVVSCSEGYNAANGSKECLPCAGTCPRSCKGSLNNDAGGVELLDRTNLQQFVNCTHVHGNIVINAAGTQRRNQSKNLQPGDVDVLQHVEEIDGYLSVDAADSTLNITNLDFLRNLRTIRGNQKRSNKYTIFIYNNPSLSSLRLRSLKDVGGQVVVFSSPKLCYADTVNWTLLTPNNTRKPIVSQLRPPGDCATDNFVCDAQCDPAAGCWDKGADQCVRCRHIAENGVCVSSCDNTIKHHLVVNGTCMPCHDQCSGSCSGLGADNCVNCRQYQDGPFCVANCPAEVKYAASNGTCLPCPAQCKNGCTGSNIVPGKGGCHACWLGTISRHGIVGPCIKNVTADIDPENPFLCKHGTYLYRVPVGSKDQWSGQYFCRPCHEQCDSCYGGSALDCKSCVSLKNDKECVSECPSGTFQSSTSCLPCNVGCALNNCTGPSLADCIQPTTASTSQTPTTSHTSSSPPMQTTVATSAPSVSGSATRVASSTNPSQSTTVHHTTGSTTTSVSATSAQPTTTDHSTNLSPFTTVHSATGSPTTSFSTTSAWSTTTNSGTNPSPSTAVPPTITGSSTAQVSRTSVQPTTGISTNPSPSTAVPPTITGSSTVQVSRTSVQPTTGISTNPTPSSMVHTVTGSTSTPFSFTSVQPTTTNSSINPSSSTAVHPTITGSIATPASTTSAQFVTTTPDSNTVPPSAISAQPTTLHSVTNMGSPSSPPATPTMGTILIPATSANPTKTASNIPMSSSTSASPTHPAGIISSSLSLTMHPGSVPLSQTQQTALSSRGTTTSPSNTTVKTTPQAVSAMSTTSESFPTGSPAISPAVSLTRQSKPTNEVHVSSSVDISRIGTNTEVPPAVSKDQTAEPIITEEKTRRVNGGTAEGIVATAPADENVNTSDTTPDDFTRKIGTAALQTSDPFDWIPVVAAICGFLVFVFVLLYIRQRNRERRQTMTIRPSDSQSLLPSEYKPSKEDYAQSSQDTRRFGQIPKFTRNGKSVDDTDRSDSPDLFRTSTRASHVSDSFQERPGTPDSRTSLRSPTPEPSPNRGPLSSMEMKPLNLSRPAWQDPEQEVRSGSSLSLTYRVDIPSSKGNEKASVHNVCEPVSIASVC